MRTLALAAITCLILAGCSGGGGSEPSSTTAAATTTTAPGPTTSIAPSSAPSSSSGPAPTTTAAPASNDPPSGTLGAALEGTVANFTLTGSDPDGDALTWTLVYGDGNRTEGTTLPATVLYDYATAGTFTVNYTLSDGTEAVSYTANVSPAAAAQSVVFSGHLAGPDPSAAIDQGCLYAALHILGFPIPSDFGALFNIDSATWGWTYAFDIPDMEADYIDAAGNILESGDAGRVPNDAAQALVCGAGTSTVDVDYNLILTPPPA